MVWETHVSGASSVAASRKFYTYSSSEGSNYGASQVSQELVKYVGENLVGSDTVFTSPFGPRKGYFNT